jgi:hypothetical protein
MRINKFVFPVLLLLIFFGVIALGVAGGYWETQGGGGRHQLQAPTPSAEPISQMSDWMVVTWQG